MHLYPLAALFPPCLSLLNCGAFSVLHACRLLISCPSLDPLLDVVPSSVRWFSRSAFPDWPFCAHPLLNVSEECASLALSILIAPNFWAPRHTAAVGAYFWGQGHMACLHLSHRVSWIAFPYAPYLRLPFALRWYSFLLCPGPHVSPYATCHLLFHWILLPTLLLLSTLPANAKVSGASCLPLSFRVLSHHSPPPCTPYLLSHVSADQHPQCSHFGSLLPSPTWLFLWPLRRFPPVRCSAGDRSCVTLLFSSVGYIVRSVAFLLFTLSLLEYAHTFFLSLRRAPTFIALPGSLHSGLSLGGYSPLCALTAFSLLASLSPSRSTFIVSGAHRPLPRFVLAVPLATLKCYVEPQQSASLILCPSHGTRLGARERQFFHPPSQDPY